MDLGALVNQFGLPIGLLFYFIWRDYQTAKEHKADMRTTAIQAVQAIDKGTEAIKESTSAITQSTAALSNSTEVISDNSDILNEVKGVLSVRGNTNGTGN